MKRLTTDSFIDRARKVHGDKYDYSITTCTGRHNKLSYICPYHGVITQEAGAHLQGHGCPKCTIKKNRDCVDTLSFIEKAKKVHGDRYDYSYVNYKGCYKPVDIVCPKHGHFMQPAYLHLQGHDCKKCGYERTHKANRSTKDDFVRKAQKKFGDRYDYSHVVYRGCYEPVEIICRKHGAFL